MGLAPKLRGRPPERGLRLRPELLRLLPKLLRLLRPKLLRRGHAPQLLGHAAVEGREGGALGLGPGLLHGLEPELNLRLRSDGLRRRSGRTGTQGNGLGGSLGGRGGAEGEGAGGQDRLGGGPGGGCGWPLGLGLGLEEDAVGGLGRGGAYLSMLDLPTFSKDRKLVQPRFAHWEEVE